MLVGYARVSSKDQNLDRQINYLKKQGCSEIFTDKLSGKNTNRPQLKAMLNYIRANHDTVVIQSLDRLSRDYYDIHSIIQKIADKKVKFISGDLPIKNDGSYQSRALFDMMMTMLSFVANNEREKIKERQRQGIELAKKKGIYKGRPSTYTNDDRQVQNLVRDYQDGMSKAKLAREYKMSRTTVYKVLKNNHQY